MSESIKTVFCAKLKKDLPALERVPVAGELGKKILTSVSKEAWQMWLGHQTMLINEYHLSLMDKTARDYLQEEMHKFFFTEEGSSKPGGFTPT
ncbi:MAG: oxidative damage protection protein [Methylacidiphilales bacterium]|nr:oxidative damage protection protein [Candidatus Methylacidiphilales bacterium]